MRTPALALTWELWRKHRPGNIAVLAALPICALLFGGLSKVSGAPLSNDLLPLALLPMLASLLWTFSVFSFTESDPKRGFTGIPPRVFSLPVNSSQVVAVLTLSGAVTVVALYVAWTELVLAPAGFRLPVRFPAAVLATAMVFFQAVVWGLASFPWLRVIAVISGAFGFMVLNAVGLTGDWPWARSETARALVVLGFLPVAYGLAVLGVRGERYGGWQFWPSVRALLARIGAALPRRQTAFGSGAAAQLWFEWKGRGWFLTLALAGSIVGVPFFLPIVAFIDSSPRVPLMALLSTLYYPMLTAGIAGLGLAKSDFWSREVALHSFQALRPLTTAQLVWGKWIMAGVVTVLGWVLAVPLGWLVSSWSEWRELYDVSGLILRFMQWLPSDSLMAGLVLAVGVVCAVALTWKMIVDGLSVGLIGRGKAINTRWILSGVWLVTFLSVTGWFCRHPDRLSRLASLIYLGAFLWVSWKLFDTIRAFRRVAQRHLATASMLAGLAALWFFLALSLSALLLLLWTHTDTPEPLLAVLAVWLWPDGALARALLNLHDNRHR